MSNPNLVERASVSLPLAFFLTLLKHSPSLLFSSLCDHNSLLLKCSKTMESNKDEALRCFVIAEKHFNVENLTAARKFCTKSISLFSTPQAEKLLVKINDANSSSTSNGSSSTSGAEEHPSATGTKHRHQNPSQAAPSTSTQTSTSGSTKKREYTQEQHTIVKKVRACKVTEYYEILELKRDCEEADIKKAYRKVWPDTRGLVAGLS